MQDVLEWLKLDYVSRTPVVMLQTQVLYQGTDLFIWEHLISFADLLLVPRPIEYSFPDFSIDTFKNAVWHLGPNAIGVLCVESLFNFQLCFGFTDERLSDIVKVAHFQDVIGHWVVCGCASRRD